MIGITWLLTTLFYILYGWDKFVDMIRLELSITPQEKERFLHVKAFDYMLWKPDLDKLASEIVKRHEVHTERIIQHQERVKAKRII